MPVVNPLARELVFKVVYYGPGLGGKTTTLQHIHTATKPEYRGKMVSLATPVDRTLYFDFLPIRVPSMRGMGVRLQLFTVPGQVYYNATRKLVLTGADGVVLVADSQRGRRDANLESLENLQENLKEHGRVLTELPLVLQYNKRDLRDVRPVEELEAELNPRGVPSFETVATSGQGVFEALDRITRLVLEDFERRMPESSEVPASALQVPEGGLTEALRLAESSPTVHAQRFDSEQPTAPSQRLPELSGADSDELPRLTDAPDSMLGEDMARSVADFGAREADTDRTSTGTPPSDDPPRLRRRREFGTVPSLDAELVKSGIQNRGETSGEAAPGSGSVAPISSRPSRPPSSRVSRSERPLVPVVEELDLPPPSLRNPLPAFSYAALFPKSQHAVVRQLEEALAAGRTTHAVEHAEHLVTRTFAAAANLVSQKEAPRDPALVALMLGLQGQRYLEFRAIARDARSGGALPVEDALVAYAFAIEARLAWRRVGG
ncbi:MAG: GTPase domain-containing protein [Myxococcales bacterium]|nr:GTPase domain-containing protein [Myxococcales bacterium]